MAKVALTTIEYPETLEPGEPGSVRQIRVEPGEPLPDSMRKEDVAELEANGSIGTPEQWEEQQRTAAADAEIAALEAQLADARVRASDRGNGR